MTATAYIPPSWFCGKYVGLAEPEKVWGWGCGWERTPKKQREHSGFLQETALIRWAKLCWEGLGWRLVLFRLCKRFTVACRWTRSSVLSNIHSWGWNGIQKQQGFFSCGVFFSLVCKWYVLTNKLFCFWEEGKEGWCLTRERPNTVRVSFNFCINLWICWRLFP